MTEVSNRIVYRQGPREWVNKRTDADRAGSVHPTQGAAERTARTMLRQSGGGELITKGLDGRIRSKDTIAPGNESRRRDYEH
ncbi:MAG TPA: DUF2188 domain-containing protein [Kiritimatiellia bacterium]|nr:DUF2188 domain-containing protein [Kiritimatiellia bacterium]